MRLGFSTGCLYKTHRVKESLKVMRELGYPAAELMFNDLQRMKEENQLRELSAPDFEGFDYVSVHAPMVAYGKNEDTDYVFAEFAWLDGIRKIDRVVFHPDRVEDFSVLEGAGFPIALENMDNRKQAYRYPEDFENILGCYPELMLVLDVNHVYTNEPTMELAGRFYERFGDRIAEIHLSGFSELHDPLFRTKQAGIVRAIRDLSAPIIVESLLDATDLENERSYILDTISGS